jgi:hypothetical protein
VDYDPNKGKYKKLGPFHSNSGLVKGLQIPLLQADLVSEGLSGDKHAQLQPSN